MTSLPRQPSVTGVAPRTAGASLLACGRFRPSRTRPWRRLLRIVQACDPAGRQCPCTALGSDGLRGNSREIEGNGGKSSVFLHAASQLSRGAGQAQDAAGVNETVLPEQFGSSSPAWRPAQTDPPGAIQGARRWRPGRPQTSSPRSTSRSSRPRQEAASLRGSQWPRRAHVQDVLGTLKNLLCPGPPLRSVEAAPRAGAAQRARGGVTDDSTAAGTLARLSRRTDRRHHGHRTHASPHAANDYVIRGHLPANDITYLA